MAEPRRIDRQRRERIVAAVLEVVERDGVEGLSHRKVARAAGVPLSAPSYYFASIEELLEAAMRDAADRDIAALRAEFAAGVVAADLPRLMAQRIARGVRDDRLGQVVVSELYIAAQRREGLRKITRDWDDTWIELLTPLVGRDAAIATTVGVGGLIQRALMAEGPLDMDELERVLAVMLDR
jgi:TetR/AcrR family transcriptional regulator, regulator of biofilm formation and stress response